MEHKPVAPNDAAAEREAFEAAYRARSVAVASWKFERDSLDGGYRDPPVDWAWWGWQARAARAPLRDEPKDLGESTKRQQHSDPECCAYCDHPLQKDSDGPTRFCPNPNCARWLMTVGPGRPPVPLTTEGEP